MPAATPQSRPTHHHLAFRRAPFHEILWFRDEFFCRPFGLPPEFDLDRHDLSGHFVGVRDDKLLASITFWPTQWMDEVPAWQVTGLAVIPAERRRGIGLRLLQYAIEVTRSDHPRHWFWAEVPIAQRKLFELAGFEYLREETYHPAMGPLVEMVLGA